MDKNELKYKEFLRAWATGLRQARPPGRECASQWKTDSWRASWRSPQSRPLNRGHTPAASGQREGRRRLTDTCLWIPQRPDELIAFGQERV